MSETIEHRLLCSSKGPEVVEVHPDDRVRVSVSIAFRALPYPQIFEDVLIIHVSDVEEAVDHRQVEGLPEGSGPREEDRRAFETTGQCPSMNMDSNI